MTPEALYMATNLVAAIGWLILIVAGRAPRIATLVAGALIPMLLAIVYGVLIVIHFAGAEGGFGSIRDVRALFANDWLLVAGWAHYLAFDLFVGSWQVRDAQHHRIPHIATIPGLILTFLFGPIGLLVYLSTRALRARTLAIG